MRSSGFLAGIVATVLVAAVGPAVAHAAEPGPTKIHGSAHLIAGETGATAAGELPFLGLRLSLEPLSFLAVDFQGTLDTELFGDQGAGLALGTRLYYPGLRTLVPYVFGRVGYHYVEDAECENLFGCQTDTHSHAGVTISKDFTAAGGAGVELRAGHLHLFGEVGGGTEGLVVTTGLGVRF